MVLDIYKSVFSRMYMVSFTINLDTIWDPEKKYIKEGTKVNTEQEKCFFEECLPEELDKVIETQHRLQNTARRISLKHCVRYF